ncbi:MAG TPA: hypothetical protein VLT33_36495 [Labilithrix sp.]|nr:hypothetical protein [Labilithrix sp.]
MKLTSLPLIALFSWSSCVLGCSAGGGTGGGIDVAEAGTEPPDASAPSARDGGTKTDSATTPPDPPADHEADYAELPLLGATGAPSVASVVIRCAKTAGDLGSAQASSGASFPGAFVQVVSVTDPQGVSDIDGPTQQLVVFAAADGTGPESHQFDIKTYGIYFGGYASQAIFPGPAGQAVQAAWCDKPWWPAQVVLTDETGHVTKGKIRIPVVH